MTKGTLWIIVALAIALVAVTGCERGAADATGTQMRADAEHAAAGYEGGKKHGCPGAAKEYDGTCAGGEATCSEACAHAAKLASCADGEVSCEEACAHAAKLASCADGEATCSEACAYAAKLAKEGCPGADADAQCDGPCTHGDEVCDRSCADAAKMTEGGCPHAQMKTAEAAGDETK